METFADVVPLLPSSGLESVRQDLLQDLIERHRDHCAQRFMNCALSETIDEQYAKNIIAKFPRWTLFAHPHQWPYVGRSYLWLNRNAGQVNRYAVTSAERAEYNVLAQIFQTAIQEVFAPKVMNEANFMNEAPHCHVHLIPRYETPVEFAGMTFIDPQPEKNYAPYEKRKLPPEVYEQIRVALQAAVYNVIRRNIFHILEYMEYIQGMKKDISIQ